MIIGKLIPAGTGMSRYRSIRVNATGENISDEEARAMWGLPPREISDEEAAAAARELLGGTTLTAVPDGDGAGAETAEEVTAANE